MGKLLVLVVLGVVAYLLFKNYQRRLRRPEGAPPGERGPEDMVKCAHCGVNLPRSEAIFSRGEFFCTPEHQRLGRK
ncbi:MAG: PP0621 family protein [Pseudomonadota bacterium]